MHEINIPVSGTLLGGKQDIFPFWIFRVYPSTLTTYRYSLPKEQTNESVPVRLSDLLPIEEDPSWANYGACILPRGNLLTKRKRSPDTEKRASKCKRKRSEKEDELEKSCVLLEYNREKIRKLESLWREMGRMR